ncbi:MAG TPA: hypothetical protein VMM79_20780, partial [Longimicrobiales bacterium]|nr:hypothetical protein [Longimicrobiales bacterium]
MSIARDSAGVSIIEVAESAHSNVAKWSLANEPTVSVGQADGPPEYQLYRVMEALRLPNSTIVVADNGSASVRFYTADGAFISSSGRQG